MALLGKIAYGVFVAWLAIESGLDQRARYGFDTIEAGCHFRWRAPMLAGADFGLLPLKRTNVVLCWQRSTLIGLQSKGTE